jgi:RNA polymerase sigma factor (sigma-70 family)
MDSLRSSAISPEAPPASAAGAALQELVGGERGRVLKGQLASWHRKATPEAIEDAIQTASKRFLEHAEGISASGQVYAWVRTTASRLLDQEEDRGERERPFNPTGEYRLSSVPDDELGPAEALIELEDGADMEMLVREVSSALPQRARDVLALYGAGLRRPQIAERLGISERAVKKNLEEIMEEARTALARLAGGGCPEGEALVLRALCGLATSIEEASAHKHLAGCGRCQAFSDRLLAWRDKAGAVLPAPVAEQADPGLLERAAHKVGAAFSSAKQQILDGGAQLKQQATSVSARAIDPTPIAAARPGGAIAAVVAGCIALGSAGAATYYCVQEGVDPLGAAEGLIAQSEPDQAGAPPPEEGAEAPVYTPAEPTEIEPEPTAAPEASPTENTPEPTKPREQEPPPPEDSFEPDSSSYQSSESEPVESYESPSEPAPIETEPTPAPAAAGPQFGGP